MSQNGREGDDEVVRRVQCGDAAAFDELYALYKRRVHAICLRIVKNDAEAEDMTQEVFIRVWRKLESFRGESEFSTWITRVAINVCLMRLRQQSKKGTVSIDELIETDGDTFRHQLATTDHRLMFTAERIAVNQAFARLSPDDSMILYLCCIEEYRLGDVAGHA